jgi:hyperosmotically inducible periplasmic protein
MRAFKLVLPILVAVAGFGYSQTPDQTTPSPDNTKVNQRDRNTSEATADRQKMNPSDRALTRNIRRSIMADKSLSTYAHNEKANVIAKAVAVAGSADKVTDQISVKQ